MHIYINKTQSHPFQKENIKKYYFVTQIEAVKYFNRMLKFQTFSDVIERLFNSRLRMESRLCITPSRCQISIAFI